MILDADLLPDAHRKAGETLQAMKERRELATQKNGRPPKKVGQLVILKLEDIGLTIKQSSRYQMEASVPDDLLLDAPAVVILNGAIRINILDGRRPRRRNPAIHRHY
ncbi:MAG: hypothetical protein ABSG67_03140 [Thermoguttaceae bacterium]